MFVFFPGHTYVHRNCAAWSEGVCPGEDDSLIHVDKAVFAAMSQVRVAFCAFVGVGGIGYVKLRGTNYVFMGHTVVLLILVCRWLKRERCTFFVLSFC